jgi:hypothetical protein
MSKPLAGLRDKLYWRRLDGQDVYHCFKAEGLGPRGGQTWISLCRRWRINSSGGQECARPLSERRCARCDGLEMARREVDEGMPESKGWETWGSRPGTFVPEDTDT